MINLDASDRQKLIDLLKDLPELATDYSRQQILELAGLGELVPKINLSGQTLTAVTEIVNYLSEYEHTSQGEVALVLWLKTLQQVTGTQQQEFLAQLLTKMVTSSLKRFEFKVVSVDRQGREVKQETGQAQYFTEDLGNGVILEMSAIPEGKLAIATKAKEPGSDDGQRPQHLVTIQPFFMGKFLITQQQWTAIASLPKINRDLALDPSYFKGDLLPVEKISWYDAIEFCQRLSKQTGREYRLPSETEWEYACRAGTIAPFHFGLTITSELANYNATVTYAEEPPGDDSRETTSVGSFPANAFGLYDMHGNLWEWCADSWHSNYEEAPTDGSAWEDDDNQYRLLRGGSWSNYADFCRSDNRSYNYPDILYNIIGMRVACSSLSILK
ncbi:MAG: SUMF1/EgtB/PvdO family nonheme iron enzyme [Prochloraceae cyanobacterium]